MLAALFLNFFATRYIEVRWQQSIIGWIIIGLIAGWLAGKLSRGRGYGCITDIVLGIIGSFIGGWIFIKLGIFPSGGFIYSLAAATVGAVVLVAIVHLFVGSDR